MNSIEFGKKCRPYNVKYREIFGYVPCRDDYLCNQEEYFSALMQAIELEKELTEFIPKKKDKRNTLKFEWVDNPDQIGEMNFTFDREKIFNLFQDYPHELTEEQKLLFEKENPFWPDFFKDRK